MKPVLTSIDPSDAPEVEVLLDGQTAALPDGVNLAAALLASGLRAFRTTPVSGAPRGPFCMMGACFDCVVEVDGITRRACMEEVRAGMRIALKRGTGDGAL